MYIISKKSVERAQESAERALQEYKEAITNGAGAGERRAALSRYREANGAYLTLLKACYSL